jgi:hypothetical protein
LLENLVVEPGKTVNHTSFLPYNIHVTSKNDIDVLKARFATNTSMASRITLTAKGITVAAEELGYWLRVHSGLLRFTTAGIASFELDERGIDVSVILDVGKDRMEQLVSVHAVKVHIHRLNYKLQNTRFSFFAWLLKPAVRPIIKRSLEMYLASAIRDSIRFVNRELVFARERLRATRIANPSDLWTFIRAVAARMIPPPNPDLRIHFGLDQTGSSVFEGIYTPGSISRVWREEAVHAGSRVEENERDGWRNDIFSVKAVPAQEHSHI